jgi:hypothetical protein
VAEAVFLVIGRDPVTGWVRDRIWASRERLLSEGLAFPPGSPAKQRAAVAELVGESGDETTTWSHLVRRVAARQETCVVVAAQGLHGADPDVLSTAVSSLSPAPVHVLHPVGAPALLTMLAWQDELRRGSTVTFPTFAADEPALPDPTKALDPFLDLLPPEQLHLVVGATPEALACRTAHVLGVDPAALGGTDGLLLPPASAELLRRFNERLRDRTGERYEDAELREAVVESYFVDPAFGPVQGGTQPTLPGVEAWLGAARALAGRLDVVGDLDERAEAPPAGDADDRDLLASGLRHWVRQLEVVERRLDRALELRRERLAGGTGG